MNSAYSFFKSILHVPAAQGQFPHPRMFTLWLHSKLCTLKKKSTLFPASSDFCHLLVTFVNSLD